MRRLAFSIKLYVLKMQAEPFGPSLWLLYLLISLISFTPIRTPAKNPSRWYSAHNRETLSNISSVHSADLCCNTLRNSFVMSVTFVLLHTGLSAKSLYRIFRGLSSLAENTCDVEILELLDQSDGKPGRNACGFWLGSWKSWMKSWRTNLIWATEKKDPGKI